MYFIDCGYTRQIKRHFDSRDVSCCNLANKRYLGWSWTFLDKMVHYVTMLLTDK